MENLPSLAEAPIPAYVRRKEWWIETPHIEERLHPIVFAGGKIDGYNGKAPAAIMPWEIDYRAGKINPDIVVGGSTSANWGLCSGLVSHVYPAKHFLAFLNPKKVPKGKQDQLLATGAKIEPVPDGAIPTEYVYEYAEKHKDFHLIDQYVHPGSVLGHKWSMDHIARELVRMDRTPTLFGAVTGTCSTLLAAHRYLRLEKWQGLKIFGVASKSEKDKVPGSRSRQGLEELMRLPGSFVKQVLDEVLDYDLIESIGKDFVYPLNRQFYQKWNRPYGPTSVLLMAGFYELLDRIWKEKGNFSSVMNECGEIVCVMFFMDLLLPYLDDPEFFHALTC
ncbi:MAG TPA: pyridoxal-phosphate dependent enzyme [Candidatus Paceibacterota bacterium]|nr:pyridoxal-phosphate dependent enzyme [Candidatus Paceibacterota bacterium]